MQENRPQALKPLRYARRAWELSVFNALLSPQILIRLDVGLAIQNGKPTLFRRDAGLVHSILCDPVISSDHPWMPPAMLDLSSFSGLLNEVERMQVLKLDPLDYTESLLSLLYRLYGKLLLNLKNSRARCKCLSDARISVYQNW